MPHISYQIVVQLCVMALPLQAAHPSHFYGFNFHLTNFVQDSKSVIKMFLKETVTPDSLGAFWPVCFGLGLGINTSTGTLIFPSLR